MCQTPDHNAIDPSNLKLELTESMVLDNINGTILKMNAREIGIEATNTVIVQTIIGMTNNLGIEVVAAGVESEDQRIFLEQCGCSLCQGYLFSKPLPIAEFEELLKAKPVANIFTGDFVR